MAAVAANRDRDRRAYRSRRSRPPARALAPRRCLASVQVPRGTTERLARYRSALWWVLFTQILVAVILAEWNERMKRAAKTTIFALAIDRPALPSQNTAHAVRVMDNEFAMTDRPHSSSPKITEMLVVPVAGHDDMLLNLSGAHAPFFTRNIVMLRDNAGRTGVGEVPGGEQIRLTLEDAKPLVLGQQIGGYNDILNKMRSR